MTTRLSESFQPQELPLTTLCPVRNTLKAHSVDVQLAYSYSDHVCVPSSVIKYRVTICTGNVSGSGTDATVFLNIFGDLGDTGERLMITSKNNVNKFESGNVSAFENNNDLRKCNLQGFSLSRLSLCPTVLA